MMGVILTPVVSIGGYSTSGISSIGVSFVSGGIIFLFVYGIILDRNKGYLIATRLITGVVLVCWIVAAWVIPAGNLALTCGLIFIIGSF